MASWVTHLMIADAVLERFPGLDRRGFCVGNIAPDCNVENENWTAFTPSREKTHWMAGERKALSDAERFYTEWVEKRRENISGDEEIAFLLGYYVHLLTDAAFGAMTRQPDRVHAAWERLRQNPELAAAARGMEETWDNIKLLIPGKEMKRCFHALEGAYLRDNPSSGYLTEILPLRIFPDYLEYMPKGCYARKIRVMGYRPRPVVREPDWIAVSRAEYEAYVQSTVELVSQRLAQKGFGSVGGWQ